MIVAVVGLGAMGSMAAWRLAARGATVIGLDSLTPPHDRGSSHGESRITRTAYAEGPWYVPLLQESLPLWRHLEAASGEALLELTGAVMIGPAAMPLIAGSLASARVHHLDHEVLAAQLAARRLPRHVLDGDEVAVLEAAGGVLRPELCISAALRMAAAAGAELQLRCRVLGVTRSGSGWTVRTETGSVAADDVVIAAGTAMGSLVGELAPRLHVERQVVGWFAVDDPGAFEPAAFPVFCHELPGGGIFYGFPTLDGRTIKVAAHHGGPEVDPAAPVDAVGAEELATVSAFVRARLRGVDPNPDRAVACRYTNTADGDFIIDRVDAGDGPLVVSACSGHGFKFSALIGDIVADLVLTGTTGRAIEAFSLSRLIPG